MLIHFEHIEEVIELNLDLNTKSIYIDCRLIFRMAFCDKSKLNLRVYQVMFGISEYWQ